MTAAPARHRGDEPTLVDLLDRTIDTGVAVCGDVVLTVADVDLVHLGLRLVLRGLDEPVAGRRPAAPVRPRLRTPDGNVRVRTGQEATADRHDDAEPTLHQTQGDELDVDVTTGLGRLVAGGASGELEPRDVQRGLAALVLTLVEVLRELMERQALRRMEGGTLEEDEVERLGRTFLALRDRMDDLKDVFGLTDDDLTIDLGPLGHLR